MIFSSILYVDIALYNAMIVGYSKNNLDRIALEYFSKQRLEGLSPNECTYSSALKSCVGLKSIDLGRMIHGIVEKSRFSQNLVVNTALIDLYMKCGKINESCIMFDSMHGRNTIWYNLMISGHGHNGNFIEALNIFVNMKPQDIDADLATFIALVTSCLGKEMSVFVHAIKHGFGLDLMLRNAILDGLFVRGATKEALEFFNKMEKRDVISWTTIVSGLTQLGLHADAIEFFKKMSSSAAVKPDSCTFSSIFKACGSLAGLERGRCIHECGIKHGIMDEFTNNSLLDMNSKCGALEESKKLFDKLASKDIVLWNTMIAGYAQHGYGHEALKLYTMMGRLDVEPNNVTFISLLSACNHCGLVEDGVQMFETMSLKHGVVPCIEHYACMVDMFGRAGMLDRAKNFIDDMPLAADASVWIVFLAACKLNSNVQLATLAKDHVKGIRGEDNPTVVAFSNMYSQIGR